jgi:hypothetical protein
MPPVSHDPAAHIHHGRASALVIDYGTSAEEDYLRPLKPKRHPRPSTASKIVTNMRSPAHELIHNRIGDT